MPRTSRARPARRELARAGLALAVLALVGGCAAERPIGSSSAPVVYGEDDRLEYFESTNELLRDIARESVVALVPIVPGFLVDEGDGTFTPGGATLAEFVEIIAMSDPDLPDDQPLCAGERFRDQPSTAACSGTLIDDDLVLTAGHCVPDDGGCPSMYFVFDFFYAAEGVLETIDADDVYECAELVVDRLDSPAAQDFAIFRLDRPVVGRTPAAVDLDFSVASGDPVAVIGFPSGIPAKIDEGGVVIDARTGSRDYFTATTDTFQGNSGSGVFDASGTLVGILVRGAVDFESRGSCIGTNVIDVGPSFDEGEDITYATNAIEALCAAVADGETSLCAGGGAGGGGGTGGASGSGGRCSASPGARPGGGMAALAAAGAALVLRARRRRPRR